MTAIDIKVSEVGPRDGLQNTKIFMPTAAKKAWISAEVAAGVHVITTRLPVSHAHSLANVRKAPDEQLAEFRRIVALRDAQAGAGGRRVELAAGLSTVFGCTLEGAIDEREVVRLAIGLAE